MNKKLSVIVPVYNTEEYLKKCLDSLVHQTYNNLEIIVINDGSTDNSMDIISSYKKKYSNIVVYTKENSGVSDTRNYGIKKSTGEFITFIDSDDFVETDLYQVCMEYIEKKDLDILMFDFVNDKNGKIYDSSLIDYYDKCEMYLKNTPNPWNKVFKKSLWNDNKIGFPTGIWYEDLATIPIFYLFTSKIDYLPIKKFHYVIRESSITHRDIYDKRCKDIIQSLNRLKEYFERYNELEKIESLFITEGLYFGTQAPIEFHKKDDYIEIKQFVISVFPNWIKNEVVSNLNIMKRLYLYNINNIKVLYLLIRLRKFFNK